MKVDHHRICPLDTPNQMPVGCGQSHYGTVGTIGVKPQRVFFTKVSNSGQVVVRASRCRAATANNGKNDQPFSLARS